MSQFPVISAGQDITAALLSSMLPLIAYKPADTSVTSSVTLINDPDLVLPVAANGTYVFIMMLNYEGGTRGSSDLKWTFTVPASATMRYWLGNMNTAGTFGTFNTQLQSTTAISGTNGAATLIAALLVGSITVAGTAGNVQLQWAQNTSNATPTIVHAQSFFAMLRHS